MRIARGISIANINRPFIEGSKFLLDAYPNSAAAYSFRKLSSSYNGNCIRIRRSGDNVEQDFGFINNYLDTVAISSFLTINSGNVTTWYDQSGNNKNLTQGPALYQPLIYENGNFITVNGKPAIDFSRKSIPCILDVALSSTNQYWTAFGVVRYNNGFGTNAFDYGRWISVGSLTVNEYSNTNGFLSFVSKINSFGATPPASVTGYNNQFTARSINYGQQYVLNALKSGNTVKDGVNNVLTTGFTQAGILNAPNLRLGANTYWGGEQNSNLNGTIQEMIYYQTDQSSNLSAINTNINSYYNAY